MIRIHRNPISIINNIIHNDKHHPVQLYIPEELPHLSPGNGPEWAKAFKSADFKLICPSGSAEITAHEQCHLAKVPAHAVVTRPEKRDDVVSFLKEQQVSTNTKCGSSPTPSSVRFSAFSFKRQQKPNFLFLPNSLKHCLSVDISSLYFRISLVFLAQTTHSEFFSLRGIKNHSSKTRPNVSRRFQNHRPIRTSWERLT